MPAFFGHHAEFVMTLFLASVRDMAEAETARLAHADIIDLKDPALGALGAVDLATTKRVVDLIAGRVHLMFESLNSIAPHARSGTVRALAVSGARRSPGFPDLPTVAEAGVPGYEAPTWSGVIAPAAVPRPIIDKLNVAINRAIGSQTFKDRFAAIGDEPAGGSPEEFAELIRKDSAKWAEVVRRSGARLD